MRTVLRVVGWAIVGFFALFVATCGLWIGSRYYQTVSRVDSTDQPPPDWLPPQSTQVVLRGFRSWHCFSGKCTRTEIEAWATRSDLPLQAAIDGTIRVYDMRRIPTEWKNAKTDLFSEQALVELEGKNVLTWSRYADNGGGISLTFDTITGNFYGSRSLW